MSHRTVVEDTDMGMEAAVAEISKLANSYVQIGFQEGEVTHSQTKGQRHKKAGLSMAQIAAYNEYGTEDIPARPFMSTAIENNKAKIYKAIDSQYNKIIEGKSTVKKSLDLIGLLVTSLMQQRIRQIQIPPNAPSTIKQKKSSKPLIDFGQMIQSIRHKTVIR